MKTAVANWGLSSRLTNLSSQFSRLAADVVWIFSQTDPAKLLGRSGIGRSAIVLRYWFSSDSFIFSIQTIQRGLSLSKNLARRIRWTINPFDLHLYGVNEKVLGRQHPFASLLNLPAGDHRPVPIYRAM